MPVKKLHSRYETSRELKIETCESLEGAGYPGGGVDLNQHVVGRTDEHLQKTGPEKDKRENSY